MIIPKRMDSNRLIEQDPILIRESQMPEEFHMVNDSDPDSDIENQEAANAANALYESHSANV